MQTNVLLERLIKVTEGISGTGNVKDSGEMGPPAPGR
jgi:hypothetical protein